MCEKWSVVLDKSWNLSRRWPAWGLSVLYAEIPAQWWRKKRSGLFFWPVSACTALESLTSRLLSPNPWKLKECFHAQWRIVQRFLGLLLRDEYVPHYSASWCYSVDIAAWQRQIQAFSKAAQVEPSIVPVELYRSTGIDDKTNLGVNPVLQMVMQRCHEFWAMTRGSLGKRSWWGYWFNCCLCSCSSGFWIVNCESISEWIL